MSFPPPNHMFQAFAQAGMPPMPPFQIPLGGLPVPLVPGSLPMGVTVPAGVASISAPPVRNQNPAIIAAPPVMSLSGPPPLMYHQQPPLLPQPKVPPPMEPSKKSSFNITVFVGNITDRASDMLIRQLLSKCGSVNNWKRVQGPNGKLQAFGFCEYGYPEAAMRAIRLLHNFMIADKKLIVKVDAKTQEKLDEYFKSKNANGSTGESSQTEGKNNDNDSSQNTEILDPATKEEDRMVRNQLLIVLKEHEIELAKDLPDQSKVVKRYAPKDQKNENLNELEMEDDKRSLIHREIDKFRDTYKKYDEEKEEEKKKGSDDRSKRFDRRDDRRSRSKDRDERRSGRSRDKDRERDRDRRATREKRSSSFDDDFDRDRSVSPFEDEEDAVTRRRNEKLVREKEHSYQRRLRDWEAREKRKAKDYDRENQKESRKKDEEEVEKQKLKQFLQDYDDDKQDFKYYQSKAFQRLVSDRKKEIEHDNHEREQERKELEQLKLKLAEEGHPDPDAEVRKRLNVKDAVAPNDINDRIKLLMNEARNNTAFLNDEDSRSSASNMGGISVKTFGFAGMKISTSTGAPGAEPAQVSNGVPVPSSQPIAEIVNENNSDNSLQLVNDAKRKRLTVSEVFNSNEDDEAERQNGKKRRPPPNALLEDSNTDSNLSTGSNKQSTSQLSQEEKRRQIKNLIDKIPTSKNELFNYNIEWDLLDNILMERRIRPWINKKISDYIGEEEQTLLDFICKKLLAQSSAQSLLDDVAMVLDDEAQVFVVKLWRLLIYEIEAKKLGLNK